MSQQPTTAAPASTATAPAPAGGAKPPAPAPTPAPAPATTQPAGQQSSGVKYNATQCKEFWKDIKDWPAESLQWYIVDLA